MECALNVSTGGLPYHRGPGTYDLASRYEKDIFVSPLEEGMERHPRRKLRAVRYEAGRLAVPGRHVRGFPELYDCLPDEGDVDACAERHSSFSADTSRR